MGFIKRFALFWYDFIVGDDWVVAVGVVAALALSALLVQNQLGDLAWVVMVLGVPLVVALSLWRVVRAA